MNANILISSLLHTCQLNTASVVSLVASAKILLQTKNAVKANFRMKCFNQGWHHIHRVCKKWHRYSLSVTSPNARFLNFFQRQTQQ